MLQLIKMMKFEHEVHLVVYLRLLQKKLLTREELYLVLNLIEIGMLFLDILKQKKDWKSFAVLNMSKLGWERAIEKLNAS